MPRPRKSRKVCCMPLIDKFAPVDYLGSDNAVIMTVDEYETIRLIDKEGFSQEECSRYMNVARTTIQNVYNSARKKLAETLVNGQVLYISGGDYIICSKKDKYTGSLCVECRAHNDNQ